MELSPEVMKDLMVLYLSGEASAETRRLVEAYAGKDERYAQLLREAQGTKFEAPPPSQDKEMETLKMTRQFITLRSLFVGGGIFFTLAPLTCVWREGHMVFLMFRDIPGTGPSLWSVAAACWVASYVMHRSIRKAGL